MSLSPGRCEVRNEASMNTERLRKVLDLKKVRAYEKA